MFKNISVAKFGGTSVADFDAMNRSADIVLSHVSTRLVILSASAGTTNILVSLAEGRDRDERARLLDDIRCIQHSIINRIQRPDVIRDEINRIIANIRVLSDAAALATSRALTDELVSHGELMSTLLFVEILRERQANTEWFDVRKVMRTNNHFGQAEPDLSLIAEQSTVSLKPRLEKSIVVTQGFIGRESKGRTTTLGRGGSDYTTALLGEALKASRIDIWTDVPGVYTTDPRIVPQAKRIDCISFEEATEMAIFGAKVLHPATLVPAVRCNIPVCVGSSKNPKAGVTRIYRETQDRPLFRALALRRKQTLLLLQSKEILNPKGFFAEVFAILARYNIAIGLVTTSELSITLAFDANKLTSIGEALLSQELLAEFLPLSNIEVEENLSLVTLIGNNLLKSNSIGERVFSNLDTFNVRMICYGASNYNLCLLVPENQAEEMVRVLHKNLFE
jgi:aspartate kinase